MAGSLNEVKLIGNVGQDPDIRTFQSGDKVANLSIATSETWKDKNSGEKKEKTEWHRVCVFGKLADVVERYVKKGSKLYIQGKLETRSWEQDGVKKYATEIILRGFNSNLLMLDSKGSGGGGQQEQQQEPQQQQSAAHAPTSQEEEDEIPF